MASDPKSFNDHVGLEGTHPAFKFYDPALVVKDTQPCILDIFITDNNIW